MSNVVEFVIKATDNFTAEMNKVQGSMNGVEKALVAIGVAGLVYKAVGLAKESLENADALSKLAQKAGVTTEDLSALGWAAKQSGVSSEGLATGLRNLGKAMSEGDLSPAGKALELVGVNARNAKGELRPTVDVLYDVADAFAKSKDDANKSTVAMQIFGKAGVDMIPLLNGGADGLRQMADQAQHLGLVISSDYASAAESINDNLSVLAAVTEGQVNKAMTALAPTLELLVDQFTKFVTEGEDTYNMMQLVADGFKALVSAGTIVTGVFRQLGTIIGGTFAALVEAVSGGSGSFERAGDILTDTFNDVDANAKKTKQSVVALWDGSAESAAAANAKMSRAMREAAESMRARNKADEEADKALEKLKQQISDIDAALKAQILTTGMSSAETKIFELRNKGAKGEVLEHAAALAKIVGEQERFKESMAAATSIIDGQRTPLEQHLDLVARINQLKEEGALTSDQQAEALRREGEQWEKNRLTTEEYKNSVVDTMTGVSEMLNAHVLSLGSVSYQVNSMIADVTLSLIKGVGDSVAASIVEGAKLEDALANVAKQVLKTVISTLVQIGIQRLVLAAIGKTAAIAEGSAQMGSAMGQVWLNSFASAAAIPVYGWAIAPQVATANLGIATAGATAAIATGTGLGAIAHGGMDYVPSESTFLLDKGERVLSPRQNTDLTAFLDNAEGSGGGVVIEQLTIHVMENATNADAFKNMSAVELRNAIGRPVVEALNEMYKIGVRPNFAMQNR